MSENSKNNLKADLKNSLIKSILIILISTLTCFLYASNKTVNEQFEAKLIYKLGSLDRTSIDSVSVLQALALNYKDLKVEKVNEHQHFLYVSAMAGNEEDASNNLNSFIEAVLEEHEEMFNSKISQVMTDIAFIKQELAVNRKQTNSGLVLKMVDLQSLANSFEKSEIIKIPVVTNITIYPNIPLAISIGLVIGFLISALLVYFQNAFQIKRDF